MATSKEQPSQEKIIETENKVMGILLNEPSEPIKIKSGVTIVFRRPSMIDKYKYQTWVSRKIREVGIDTEEDKDLFFYFNYYGIINANIVSVTLEDGSEYEFNPAKDKSYSFLFEKYVVEELYNKGIPEEEVVLDAINEYIDWQNSLAVERDDIKNS